MSLFLLGVISGVILAVGVWCFVGLWLMDRDL